MSRTQAQKAATHRRIMESAVQVFATRGYYRATVDDIAERAATSKGSVYFHFESKEAVLLALMDEMAGRLWQAVEGAFADVERELGAPEKIARILAAVLETLETAPDLARVVLVEASVAGDAARERQQRVRQAFTRAVQANVEHLLETGRIAPVNPELTALFFFGTINELVVRWLDGELPVSLSRAARDLARYNLTALGLPAPGEV